LRGATRTPVQTNNNKMKKYWMLSPKTSLKVKLSESDKKNIQDYFHPLIESFKNQCILKNPNKEFNYLIDIYSKWYQNYFYLCEKFKSEHLTRLADEFEVKFVKLKYTGKNQFDFSYFRHTGQWHLVASGFTLDECKEMILSNPVFQPIG
jgi:hypothetical protein